MRTKATDHPVTQDKNQLAKAIRDTITHLNQLLSTAQANRLEVEIYKQGGEGINITQYSQLHVSEIYHKEKF